MNIFYDLLIAVLKKCIYSSFKLFLELEPQLRDIIHKFYESKYASCLRLLEEMKVGYTLELVILITVR